MNIACVAMHDAWQYPMLNRQLELACCIAAQSKCDALKTSTETCTQSAYDPRWGQRGSLDVLQFGPNCPGSGSGL